MHIISRKAIQQFWGKYPNSKPALIRWFIIVEKATITTFDELRQLFPSADFVGDFVVFNIGGNNYRLIASIHFNRNKLYVRHILTHAEYDKGNWKL